MKLDKISKTIFLQKLNDFLLETENIRDGGFGSTGKDFNDRLDEHMKESASSMKDELLQHIEKYKKETGKTEVDLYKEAQVDRRDFSRFLKYGTLTKSNIICFCVALKLDFKKAENLLMSAGYAFDNSTADRIIKFFFEEKHYDINDLNEALYSYKQKLIGIQKNVV